MNSDVETVLFLDQMQKEEQLDTTQSTTIIRLRAEKVNEIDKTNVIDNTLENNKTKKHNGILYQSF